MAQQKNDVIRLAAEQAAARFNQDGDAVPIS